MRYTNEYQYWVAVCPDQPFVECLSAASSPVEPAIRCERKIGGRTMPAKPENPTVRFLSINFR